VDGTQSHATFDVRRLADLVSDAAGDPTIYKDLDAATRAYLDDHDPTALLRLSLAARGVDQGPENWPVVWYSDELYYAVACLDYPQLFDMSSPPSARPAQLDAQVAALPSDAVAPFTAPEWLSLDQYTEASTACMAWPSPQHAEAPVAANGPLLPPSVRVLVLSGEFDSWTPGIDLDKVTAILGGTTRVVHFANSTHVVAVPDRNDCAAPIVRAFVTDPSASLDTSCAAAIPPVRAVGTFPQSLAQVTPPTSSATVPSVWLQLAGAAVATAGDALDRFAMTSAQRDHGLHGGHVRATAGGGRFTLQRDQFVPGVDVTGRVSVNAGIATATLYVRARKGRTETVQAQWQLRGAGQEAAIHAQAGSVTFDATTTAP
jgi:hypothetical protein